MKKLLILIALSFPSLFFAQSYDASGIIVHELKGHITPSKVQTDWSAFVFNLEAPFPGTESARNYLELLKQSIPAGVYVKAKSAAASEIPLNAAGFVANPFGGIPNDNDIAISNDGMIVSVCNSTVYIYHESSDSIWQELSLNVFSDSLNLQSNSYDPRVEYDPAEDKFILVYLNGSSSNNTNIAIGFSKTNNPVDGWNLYALDGNPLNDNAWSDFPAIAITNNELFVTVNHVNSDSVSWQTGFMRSAIWQLNKHDGYAGNSMASQVYTNVQFGGKFIRNLLPIKGGSGIVGPEMYFLSNRNFDFQNDTFFVVHINDELANAGNIELTTDYIISDVNYGIPPNTAQPLGTFLQTNDSRPLGGFIENGKIHFVGNTLNAQTNLCGIYHSIYEIGSGVANTVILGGDELEYGYPNISYTGYGFADNQAIIGFNHSSIDSFPGVSALFYSEADGYSDRLQLKNGDTQISLISGDVERWGDYTGNQRKYNEPSTVWISGLFAKYREFALGNTNRAHETWVAKLQSQDQTYVGIEELEDYEVNAYPNPSKGLLFVSFNNTDKERLNFQLFNLQGALVKDLLSTTVKSGKNMFQFSTESLATGSYLLLISNQAGQSIHSHTILVE